MDFCAFRLDVHNAALTPGTVRLGYLIFLPD
jgi:hypothetical protein